METGKIFEMATRCKFRFPFKGQCTVEDLWDLSVTNLDQIFKELNAQKKQADEESLLATKSAEDEELEAKISIVRYIVSVKQNEADARALGRERKQQAEQLKTILAEKELQELKGKTAEEIKAMIAELEK